MQTPKWQIYSSLSQNMARSLNKARSKEGNFHIRGKSGSLGARLRLFDASHDIHAIYTWQFALKLIHKKEVNIWNNTMCKWPLTLTNVSFNILRKSVKIWYKLVVQGKIIAENQLSNRTAYFIFTGVGWGMLKMGTQLSDRTEHLKSCLLTAEVTKVNINLVPFSQG